MSLLQTGVVIAILCEVCWVTYCRYLHPLSVIPGPFLASFSRIWIVYYTARGDMEHTQRELHRKHGIGYLPVLHHLQAIADEVGHLVRIAPNEVACSDPEAIKTIYSTKNVFTKSDYYDAWVPPTKRHVSHFAVRDEKLHAERRRIVNNVYSMSSVLESEGSIDSCTEMFCENMRDFAKRKSAIDLSLWTNMYAFDVVGELFFGSKFGFMQERTDIGGYMKSIDSLLPAFTIGGTVPSYLTKLCLVFTILFSSSIRGALGAVKNIKTVSKVAVEKRRREVDKNTDDKHDMLRKMLQINAERGEKLDFTISDINVESQGAIFAGADTTAIAMNSILYHLMRTPRAYKKLTRIVDDAVADGTLSMPAKYAEAIKIPYLRACINEGMRLHPSVGLVMPRIVPAGGATISGFQFPEGYRVGVNPAVVQYDEDIFGEDADQFNPDRWIEGDIVSMEKAMIQFGAGTRTCIGKNISLSEIYKLILQLVRDFRFRLVEPKRALRTHNYWFNKQTGIWVLVDERFQSSDSHIEQESAS